MRIFENWSPLSWNFHVLTFEHVVVVLVDDGRHVIPVNWIQSVVHVVFGLVEAVESQCTVCGRCLESEKSFVDVSTDVVVCFVILVPGNQQRHSVVRKMESSQAVSIAYSMNVELVAEESPSEM